MVWHPIGKREVLLKMKKLVTLKLIQKTIWTKKTTKTEILKNRILAQRTKKQ